MIGVALVTFALHITAAVLFIVSGRREAEPTKRRLWYLAAALFAVAALLNLAPVLFPS